MGLIALEIIQYIVPAVLGLLLGAAGSYVRESKKRYSALEDGMTVQLMRGIKADYESYVVLGKHLTVHDKEIHERTYEAYAKLGGNGVAKQMHEEIMSKQPWIVLD